MSGLPKEDFQQPVRAVTEVYMAVRFEHFSKYTYILGTYLTEKDAYDRIVEVCVPHPLTGTAPRGTHYCPGRNSVVWVKPLVIGPVQDNKNSVDQPG